MTCKYMICRQFVKKNNRKKVSLFFMYFLLLKNGDPGPERTRPQSLFRQACAAPYKTGP